MTQDYFWRLEAAENKLYTIKTSLFSTAYDLLQKIIGNKDCFSVATPSLQKIYNLIFGGLIMPAENKKKCKINSNFTTI
jgi:hypothetical protein